MNTAWKAMDDSKELHLGSTGQPKWITTHADPLFGSKTELRAVAEVYASVDAPEKFVNDFVALG